MSTIGAGHESVAARFDRTASTYDGGAITSWLAGQVAQRAGPMRASLVLDVATGTGLAIEAMIAQGSTASFVGVDISAGMLAQAARKPLAARTDLRLLDGNRLPFGDATFDLTTCVSAMPYFPDPVGALTEWSRVTRSGRIVFSTWVLGGLMLPRLVRQAAAEAGVHLHDPNAALGTPEGIETVITEAGLRLAKLALVEHQEPLRHSDIEAWERVTGSEFGIPMQHAAEAVQQHARHQFGRLLQSAIDAGQANITRAYIVETERA